MGCGDPADRRAQRGEGPFGDQRGDVGGHRAAWVGFVDHHQAAGLFHAFENAVLVQRAGAAQVQYFAGDALARQAGGGVQRQVDHAAVGHQGDVVAVAEEVRLAEGYAVQLLGYLALHRIEQLVLAEDHRVVVADRLDQQALGVVGRRRADHLEAGDVGP